MSDTTTPSSRWAADGQRDPHGDRYACERAALALGNLTDDELANAVFLHGNEQPTMADMAAGKALAGIVYLTAAKDRIRWLSRALADAIAPQPAELAEQHGVDAVDELVESWTRQAKERFEKNEFSVVAESLIICARELKAALAATGKQQVGEVQGDAPAVIGMGSHVIIDGYGATVIGLDPYTPRLEIEWDAPKGGKEYRSREDMTLAATGEQQVGEVLTDTYVQTVPDKCDRIVWRGHYYHLPIKQAGEVQGDAAELLAEMRDVEDYFKDVDPNPIHLATVQAAIETLAARQPVAVKESDYVDVPDIFESARQPGAEDTVSPMAKMAAALREKAAIEHTEYSQRVQSGEWGTIPEAGTQADFCRYCEGSGWGGESRKTKCPACSGTGMPVPPAQGIDPSGGMAQEYQRWIDFYHAGEGSYGDFLSKHVLIDDQRDAAPGVGS